MNWRITRTVGAILIFILAFGSTLSLAVSRKDSGKAKRLVHNPPSTGKGSGSNKTKPIFAARLQTTSLLPGQTVTLLPDGRSLLIGGESENGPQDGVAISDPRTGQPISLRVKLQRARSWHSATMLPDGRVLVLGGVGKTGLIVRSAEIFDPETQTFALLPVPEMAALAYHSATLLTDGRVLITGGSSERDGTSGTALVWDFKTKTIRAVSAGLSVSRRKHNTTLLNDGNLLIEGGTDNNGNQVTSAELFNTETGNFNLSTISSEQLDENAPFLSGSLPANGASDARVDSFVALRFSKRLRVETLNPQALILTGPEGTIETKVVPAEVGRLAFVTPKGPLLPGFAYTLTIAGAVDDSGKTINPAAVTFTTQEEVESPVPTGDSEDWIPNKGNLSGDWRSNRPDSPWQKLAPLQAEPGVTASSGQILLLNGNPLENVTLQVGTSSTRTDRTGRFLLAGLVPGHHVLMVDGRSASTRGKTYGIFKIGIDVTEGRTNPLSFTIWMPRIDTRNAINIPIPTTKEASITTPHIPGLEVRIPAGAIVRDTDGRTSTEISITPIPVDRPPFPLPANVSVPVFFTVQPGAAQVIPPRARVVYPNYISARPGTRIDFWNYDPADKGWYIYGKGTVTPDGKQIVPDPGVVIYEFTGFMIGSGGSPPSLWPLLSALAGDPTDLATGLFVLEKTDLVLPDTVPIVLNRTYRPGDNASRAFGIGSTHHYEMFLWSVNNYQEADLILPDGGRIHYVRISSGTSYSNAVYEHTSTPSAFYKSRLSWNGGGWDLKLKDGTVFVFPDFAPLKSIRDHYGNQITITRSNGDTGNITQITSPNSRWIQFTYDSSNRIIQAKDNVDRTVNYSYDTGGRLATVTDPKGGVTQYTYDSANRMLTIKDARQIVFLSNEYDSSGRVTQQTQADGSTFQFVYVVDANGKITQTDVTDPRGNIRRVTFNSNGYTVTDTYAFGQSEQQTVTVERQAGTNLPVSVTDSLNRKTAYSYDPMGNLTSLTELAETSEAVTTSFTYETTYNQPTSVTDPLNHLTSFAYDNNGNVTNVTDPLNHQIGFSYNSAGQIVSMTNPLGNATQWTYGFGNLLSITNPLGNGTSRFVDGAGRGISTVDAMGRVRRYTYDPLNQIVQATDPLGGNTLFNYDPNGNLLSVTDARGSVTAYSYDTMDRVVSRRDPLLREETYQYDTNGNVIEVTDRKGQATSYAYDALDRLILVSYADDSTTSYVYDAGNRLVQVVDSISGTIIFTCDNLDRLTSETTAQGTVNYTYDSGGRRTSMTVAGQPVVNYTYDAADRLTGITQGQSSVGYTYDAAGRRTSLTLPNGVVGEYGYDVGSNLTSITYRQGANVLGNLTYQYDAARKRTKVGGSFARTGLPQTLPSATYDAANQITQRGTTTFSYDANGNILSDGSNTYSWDARNRLSATSGLAVAGFQYDAFDRRTSKTLNGQSTDHLYDGADVVQELSAGVPTANILLGLGVDERHTCSCNGVGSTLLTDGLGSALALTDSSGALQTEYTYDAFGNTTSSGSLSSNTSQYTGRENDANGLYYYRARYYNPVLQRFISEDPIGFAGGDVNLYAYVGNSPTNFTDPGGTTGVLVPIAGACLEGAVINAAVDSLLGSLAGRKITASGLARSALMGCGMGIVGLGFVKALGLAISRLGVAKTGLNIAGKGSSANLAKGTTLPRNLREQLAIEQATANPTAGTTLPTKMNDPRWPASQGWVKMQQIIKPGGEAINVHYVRNRLSGLIDDFKIVIRGRR